MTEKDDTVKLVVNGFEISGWTDVRITRGIERMPNDFDIGLTERYPGETQEIVVSPGDSCYVMAGSDVLVTGFVDRYIPSFSEAGHFVRIQGRGRCQDLVDCSAEWPKSQMAASTAYQIASNLAQAYPGIDVTCSETDLFVVPQFNILLGETPFQIIDRVCKMSSLLAYEGPDGNLILARVGSKQHSSGLFEGQNVQAATVQYSMDQRFSEYTAFLSAIVRVGDPNVAGNTIATIDDEGVDRNRKRYLIAEAVYGYEQLAKRRAAWEMNRRNGRSVVASVTVDSWRDSDGCLWEPNKLVPTYLPSLKLRRTDADAAVNWTIGEVTFSRGEDGTKAHLTVMSPDAFAVEPVALQYGVVDTSRALP